VKGLVVVFAGGTGPKTLWAYHAASGEPAWTADVGQISYTSPHLATLAGEEQILFVSDRGLFGVEPATGKVLWEHNSPARAPRSVQPQPVGTNRVLMSTGMEQDTVLIEVTRTEGGWATRQVWASRHLRPSFNDFVVHGGCAYGFDNHLFCCIDLETGKRPLEGRPVRLRPGGPPGGAGPVTRGGGGRHGGAVGRQPRPARGARPRRGDRRQDLEPTPWSRTAASTSATPRRSPVSTWVRDGVAAGSRSNCPPAGIKRRGAGLQRPSENHP